MKTNFEAIDVIWKRLKDSNPTISGGIYKISRPFNSKVEDIIINALPISDTIPQECVVNVNCYVPNIEVSIKGQVNQSVADTKRMKTLADLLVGILNDIKGDGYFYFVSGQGNFQNEAGNEYYINLRITFLFKNL